MTSFLKYLCMRSCCEAGESLSRGTSTPLDAVEEKLEVGPWRTILRRERVCPSFSVPESLSVWGPSVSVALSPSVADGVEQPTETAEVTEALR